MKENGERRAGNLAPSVLNTPKGVGRPVAKAAGQVPDFRAESGRQSDMNAASSGRRLALLMILLLVAVAAFPPRIGAERNEPALPPASPDLFYPDTFRYHTYGRTMRVVDSLVARYPDIARLETLGITATGQRAVVAVKVSDNPGLREAEPTVLFNGAHHGSEGIGPEICLYLLDSLLANYSRSETRRWIDSLQIFVVPMVNPDGHEVNFLAGDTWWRKNTRDNNHNGSFDHNDGVNLNRNYDFYWSNGEPDSSSREYRGPYAFSEVETQGMANLTRRERFVADVCYHSSRDGIDWEKVYYPSVYTTKLVPDYSFVREVAVRFALSIVNDAGTGFYTPVGTSIDGNGGQYRSWSYYNYGTFSITNEVGTGGYYPPPSRVDSLCQRNFQGVRYLLNRVLGSGVWGRVFDSLSGAPLPALVQLVPYDTNTTTYKPIRPRYADSLTGWFFRLTDSIGDYRLQVSCSGYVAKSVGPLAVAANVPTKVEIPMVRERDVGITRLLVPAEVDSGWAVVPACSVYNWGRSRVSYFARMKIGGFYDRTVLVENHDPGTSRCAEFPADSTWPRGSHVACCSTRLDGDIMLSNNWANGPISVLVRDVACAGIEAPADTVDSGRVVIPRARFHNRGNRDASFGIRFTIGLDYDSTIVRTVAAGADSLFEFPEWRPAGRGVRSMRCSTRLVGDCDHGNDAWDDSVVVVPQAPAVPQLAIPEPDAVNVPVEGRLVWLKADRAESYDVYLDTIEPPQLVSPSQTDTVFDYFGLAFNTDYYWQVRARNAGGSSLAEVRVFSTVSYVPPVAGWTRMEDLPSGGKNRNTKDGGALCAGKEPTDANDTTYVYAFKGNNTYEFCRYNTVSNTWAARESIPALNRLGKKKGVKKGAALAVGADGKVYATKGNGTLDFWVYDPAARAWTQLPDVPAGAKTLKEGVGAAAVRVSGDDYIFLLKGSGTYEFFCYDVAFGVWDVSLPTAPAGTSGKPYKNGSAITFDGGDTIYCLKGSYNEFSAYGISGRTWVLRDPLPLIGPSGRKKKAKAGAGLAAATGVVYGLKGGNTNEFYQYKTTDHKWYAATDMPTFLKRVNGGGALAYADANRSLYALRGNRTLEFWSYGPLGADGLRLSASGQQKDVQSNSPFIIHHSSLSVTPNPFTSSLNPSISYSLPTPGNVSLKLYDIAGKLAGTLASGYRPAGSYAYRLSPTAYRLSAGVYLLRYEAGEYRATEKLIIE